MEDHQMVIDSAADQAKPTAFDFVDRRSRVALAEQQITGGEDANGDRDPAQKI